MLSLVQIKFNFMFVKALVGFCEFITEEAVLPNFDSKILSSATLKTSDKKGRFAFGDFIMLSRDWEEGILRN